MPRKLTCECGECVTCKGRERMRAWVSRPGNHARHIQNMRNHRRRVKNGDVTQSRQSMDEQALKWLQERGFR